MNDDPARRRFAVMQLVRMSGVAMVLVGILAVNSKIAVPVEAGYLLLLLGVVEVLIIPQILARKWRSPKS